MTNIENYSKFIAQLINGGEWENPQYYTEEQRNLWRGHAAKIIEEVKRND